ncbi:hypothetical protein [Nocardia sp. NPDC052566]|uniref:hypothetical protein n=1 Tax=Nocardia sp. NPDC052566 TaxID=3364330 RepID=UPI0037C6AC0B
MVTLLQKATRIATEHGRNWVGVEDVQAALLEEQAPFWWPRAGLPPITPDKQGAITPADYHGDPTSLSYNEFRDLINEWVPGPTPDVGPHHPATVTYEISGPHATEFTATIERS